jgi:hypothetical protein
MHHGFKRFLRGSTFPKSNVASVSKAWPNPAVNRTPDSAFYLASVGAARRLPRSLGRTDRDSWMTELRFEIVWYSPNRDRMSRVPIRMGTARGGSYLPRTMSSRLRHAGFQVDATKIIPVSIQPMIRTLSRSAYRFNCSFVSGRNGLTRDEAEARAGEIRHAGKRGEYFFSRNPLICFLAKNTVTRVVGASECSGTVISTAFLGMVYAGIYLVGRRI